MPKRGKVDMKNDPTSQHQPFGWWYWGLNWGPCTKPLTAPHAPTPGFYFLRQGLTNSLNCPGWVLLLQSPRDIINTFNEYCLVDPQNSQGLHS